MLSINKRILLYSLLVLAIGSVVALTGLFKITANIIAPKQKIISSIEVKQADLIFENITNVSFEVYNVGSKYIIEDIKLNETTDLQVIPIFIKIDVNNETDYKPTIYVNLRSLGIDLGAPVLLVLATSRDYGDIYVKDLIRYVFNKDVSIKFHDKELRVLAYSFCDTMSSSCSLYYKEKYESNKNYYPYDLLIVTRLPYNDRIWKLEIEII